MNKQLKYFEKKKKIIRYIYFFNKKLRNKKLRNIDEKIYKTILEEISTKYPNDYIIFSRNGVGDIFFVARLLKEFKKTHTGRIIYLSEKPSLKPFLKSFSSIDEIIINKSFKILQCKEPLQRPLEKGKVNFLFFPYRGQKTNYVFADSYANLLDINTLNTEFELPNITDVNYQKANEEFKRLNIKPEKTVILIPEAVMFDHRILNEKFWIELANKLTNLGYDVIFNSSNKSYKTKFKTTFLPIMDFLAFAQQVKHIISFRSGICDLLVGMNIANITSIYPPNLEVIWADKFIFDNLLNKYHQKTKESEFENIFHIYSLNSNFKRHDIKEIIHHTNKQTMQEIINSVTDEILTTNKIKTTII